jgi:xanthine/uracil/vitamin C permease (AzgA family)
MGEDDPITEGVVDEYQTLMGKYRRMSWSGIIGWVLGVALALIGSSAGFRPVMHTGLTIMWIGVLMQFWSLYWLHKARKVLRR